MKTTSSSLLATLFLLAGSVIADAAPGQSWSPRGGGNHGSYESRYDRGDSWNSRGRGDHGPRMSLEARAQLRLRQLGFYRGPVDGDFGRGSRAALVRFQYRNGLRPTGWLDYRTMRALRV